MISFDVNDHRFNLRAAAVFIVDDFVLLHRLEGDAIWALPGGRVVASEDGAAAVVRELLEELSETVECGELLFVIENFFEHQSRSNHEVGLYFSARLNADSPLRSRTRSHFGMESSSQLEFQWFRLSELSAVNLRPAFLRGALAKPTLTFQHVVHRG